MEKMYLVSEGELRDLIHNTLIATMFTRTIVGSWSFCDGEYNKIIKEYFPDATEEELDEFDFENCVNIILNDYCEVER